MKVSGTSLVQAPPQQVWQALNDPAVLVQAIPGCQRLETLGADSYKMTVAAGVGAITGVYDGEIHLTDHQEPFSFRLRAHGAGAPGTIGAEVLVMLSEAPDGGTSLTYDADAVVGGAIGGVGQRMLTGVSKKMADEFFGNVQSLLAGLPPPMEPTPAGVSAGLRGMAPPPNHPSLAGSLREPDPSTVGGATPLRPAAAAAAAAATPADASSRAPAQAGQVFTPPAKPSTGGQPGFLLGAVLGAASALAGVVVGAWITGRRRR